MIYDALRHAQADSTSASNVVGPVAAVGVSRRSRTRSAWIVSGLGGAAFAGIVVLALAQLDDTPATAARTQADVVDVVPAPAPVTGNTVAATTATVPADAATDHAAPPPLPAPLPAFATVPASPVTPLSPPDPTTAIARATVSANTPSAPVAPAADEELTDIQSAHLQINVTRAAATSPAPLHDVGEQLAALDSALAANDVEAIPQLLATLSRQLPGNSLTLLRARAWAAHSQGHGDTAETHYRTILRRVPNDEQAGVNLALLEAARGDSDAAQARLRRLASHNGNSPLIARAMDQLSGTGRP